MASLPRGDLPNRAVELSPVRSLRDDQEEGQ